MNNTVYKTDVLVIGAGPAGLAASLGFAEKSRKITLLEAGRHFEKRFCPVDMQKNCRGCGKICNVISGFGGCIHYGDGAKLSKFPSGRRLFEIIGEDFSNELSKKALHFMLHDAEMDLGFKGLTNSNIPFLMKDYSVAMLSEEIIRTIIEHLYKQVSEHQYINLELETRVSRIEPYADYFEVSSIKNKKTKMIYHANKVIVAVGRYGQNWWRQELQRLDLQHKIPYPSVGIRFECPARYLLEASKLHNDFKTTMTDNGIKVKTFCFCAGSSGGQIKFTDYGNYTLLDGHVTPDAKLKTANFALLAQLKDDDNNPRDYRWIEKNFIEPYKKLRTDRPGKPVIQWYQDFKAKHLTCESFNKFETLAGYRPSLSDYYFANLALIFPDSIHKAFCSVFEQLLAFFISIDPSLDYQDALTKFSVIGLELESMWDELCITPHMETSLPNLHACGDCAGVAQGILQSFVSGLAAAQSM